MIRSTLFIKLLMFLLLLTFKTMAYEEATYGIVHQNDFYEIRYYDDRLAVQATYTSQDSSFRNLFNYISGANINSKKIKMTTPVTQSKISSEMVMQFYLPKKFTKKTAPVPTDPRVKLIIIEEGYYAVIKYSGRLTDNNFDEHKKILKNNLLKDNIEILSSVIRATYNGPFTLPFLRRNEVMFRVVWKEK